ncbi:MAG: hypothetical protein FP814_03220 [Desulfobacterium sp.]|nr:hypothetical protein [Desulfobacterium sp.]MBU3950431.1 hypothetical protein [Pseudomonadota bacterium]
MKITTITVSSGTLPLKLFARRFFHILALVAVLSLFGCENNDFHNYREKLAISVEWGAKAGRFGLAIPAEGEIVGPRTFAIDDNGYIHIFDSIKKNIKVFNSKGIFQKSVGKNLPGYSLVVYRKNYYFLDGENIYKYNLSGISEETYPIAPALTLYEGYAQWMRIDDYGDLYVKAQGKTYRICKNIGRRNAVLSEDAQVKSERNGTPNNSGTYWFKLAKKNSKHFNLRIHDKQGNPVNDFPIETADTFGSVIFLDQDENGVIYLETKRIGADGIAHLEIRRYLDNGRLIQSVELPNSYYTIVYKKIVVDKKGALYQLQTAPSGVKIVKWGI